MFFAGRAFGAALLGGDRVTEAEVKKIFDAEDVQARYVALDTTDSDQDADEDILLVDELGNVWLMLNQRADGFTKPKWVAGPVNDMPGPVSLDLSDVDLDNDEDLILTSSMGEVYLVRAEGRGRYRDMNKISDALNTESGPVQVRVSDVDLDNDEDIIVGNNVGILYQIENVGMGNFGRASVLAKISDMASGPYDFVFTDLDFDNYEEILFVDASGTVYLLENLRGRFGSSEKIAGPFNDEPSKVDIEIADYDYDGDDDIVLMIGSGAVMLIENTGEGDFAEKPVTIAPPLGPEDGERILALSDVIAETSEDIAVVNTMGWVFLLENDGQGKYEEPRLVAKKVAMSGGLASVVREDMNGDGAEDTLILDSAGHLYLVLGEYDLVDDRRRDLTDDL
ncbi:MAG: VCBS repeat-containing protein [Candidatus Hydrogenedentota bacterium]